MTGRRGRWPWIFAAALAGTVSAGACGPGTDAPSAPASSSTFTMIGDVEIENTSAGAVVDLNNGCRAGGGYSDLNAGTAVTVADPQGHIVATGSIIGGQAKRASMTLPGDTTATYYVAACLMGFTVPGVPQGLASYSVTVSHRGTQVVTPEQAHDTVKLTLGS